MSQVSDEVVALFAKKGEAAYYGEAVSQLEHALQAAWCAKQEGAPDHLIVAALVHDIGHLVDESPQDIADHRIDVKHEEVGQEWLTTRFGKNVVEPVHLHVDAKRYLCATDPTYFSKLSPASVQSLALQGGPMNAAEIAQFENHEFYRDAVMLRQWDDRAKIPGLPTPAITDYRNLIDTVALES